MPDPSTDARAHVVCIGAATLDTIAAVTRHPAADERVEASELTTAGGGPAATAAVTLARLGVRVFFVGRVGDDGAGREIREGLATAGVDVSELELAQGGRSATSAVLVSGRGRSIAAYAGTLPPLRLSERAAELCQRAAWIHVDHVGYVIARDLPGGTRLSVDGGNPIDSLDLARAALFAPTEKALEALFPGLSLRKAMGRVLEAGVELVVVTRGPDGSAAAAAEGTFVEADPFVTEIRSTLGAGDVFHGALIAALVGGRPLPEALARANAAAALSCRGLDGRSAIPTAAELERAIR